MVKIEENVSLQTLNTFGIDVRARYYVKVESTAALQEVIQHPVYSKVRHLILGGGSNLLFSKDFDGLVIHCQLKGRRILSENDASVAVQFGAGENWHACVDYSLDNQWGGVENLSLIPGTVGAAPIQNIGAYGVEIKDVVETVEGIDLTDGSLRVFSKADCRFSYRESAFKAELKEKFFISSVTLRMTKRNHHLSTHYGAIQEVLRKQNVVHPTIHDISNAVISIRRSKLPDPEVIGNAGSFFKNPTVSHQTLDLLKRDHPEIVHYPADNQNVKLAAAWLIEKCGWKGKRFGNVGVHEHQALVLVNYGGGKGEEIFQLAMKILASVKEKFGITLTTEVNIV